MLKLSLDYEGCESGLCLLSDFRDSVRKGELGKTAELWVMYMDRVWLIGQLQRTTKPWL
jgi:hypothetical protein